MRILTQNSNTVELVKKFEKNQGLHIQIKVVMSKMILHKLTKAKRNKNLKRVRIQYSIGKSNFFFGTFALVPWVVLATWPHLGALQKIQEK
jgi:hypothetical protein